MAEYQAYMLRVWQEDDELRIVLESADSGERQGFPTLAAMVAFLDRHGCAEAQDAQAILSPLIERSTA